VNSVFFQHLERSQLCLRLMSKTVTDPKGKSFKCEHESRVSLLLSGQDQPEA
jgi:hypothetical protein